MKINNIEVKNYGDPKNLIERALKIFKCRQCGTCCRVSKEIALTPRERPQFKKFLVKGFLPTPCPFIRKLPNQTDTDFHYCSIYKYRPKSCQIFPLRAIQVKERKYITLFPSKSCVLSQDIEEVIPDIIKEIIRKEEISISNKKVFSYEFFNRLINYIEQYSKKE